MILGIGSDLIEIARVVESIERNGRRFLDRISTADEQKSALASKNEAAWMAGLFAAKEAVAKALGTGITARVKWTDITLTDAGAETFTVELSGGAHRRAQRQASRGRGYRVSVTISIEAQFAFAFAIVERR